MAKLRSIPDVSVPLVKPNGLITQPWFEYFKSREMAETSNLADVSITVPSNGQVLIFNSATGKYEPGAN